VNAGDSLTDFEYCRDESCVLEELHLAHEPVPLRGRTPKACPQCLELLKVYEDDEHRVTSSSCTCGWSRSGRVEPVVDEEIEQPISLSPWVPCPACEGKGCPTACGMLGYVPRLRAMHVRQEMARRGRA
jgi:hypothetical protein